MGYDSAAASSYSSSSPSSSGLYVPVHKRNTSSASAGSAASSSRAHTPELNNSSSDSESPSPTLFMASTYSISTLLSLAHSPLARMSPDVRASMRERVPEIMTNRKQRKAAELRDAQHATARVPTTYVFRVIPSPVTHVLDRKIATAPRIVESSRHKKSAVIDQGCWRGAANVNHDSMGRVFCTV